MSATSPALRLDIEVRRDGFTLEAAFTTESGVQVLFGPSGAGKSTILQSIAGLVTPRAGEIVLDGDVLFRRGRGLSDVNLPARVRRAGYVFQDYALFPHLSALDNVAYPLWRRPGARDRALEQLRRMGLANLVHRYPHELSGGQQQRVAIARAVAAGPRILLMDEPFSALDIETRREVRAEIRKVLEDVGVPVVLVTHDREEALALGDSIVVLDQGRVITQGEPVSVLGRPQRERVARLVGVENILRLKVIEIAPMEGVMRCGQDGFLLEAPFSDARVGEVIAVGIRADDVLLASSRPEGLSAGNMFAGRVVSVQTRGPIYDVALDCGVLLHSHVTKRAVDKLGIAPGAGVWAVVKTTSCHILQDNGRSQPTAEAGAMNDPVE